MNEQNSLPIHSTRPQTATVLYWERIVTPGNTHDNHILEPLVELGLRKLENEKQLPQIQKKSWYALDYFKGT
jgi:hypothetical protein